jgi:hypothetical protein
VTGWWGAPSGTVIFLFTDIEGSTRPWETQPEMMRPRTTHTPVGDGGGTFAALTVVALILAALGDGEAALLIGSRCESRSVHRSPGSENVNDNPFGTAPYLELRSGQTAAVLDAFANGRPP